MFLFEIQIEQPAQQKQKKSNLNVVPVLVGNPKEANEMIKAADTLVKLNPKSSQVHERAAQYLQYAQKLDPKRKEGLNEKIMEYYTEASRLEKRWDRAVLLLVEACKYAATNEKKNEINGKIIDRYQEIAESLSSADISSRASEYARLVFGPAKEHASTPALKERVKNILDDYRGLSELRTQQEKDEQAMNSKTVPELLDLAAKLPVKEVMDKQAYLEKAIELEPKRKVEFQRMIADAYQRRSGTWPEREVSTKIFDLTKAYEYDPTRKRDNFIKIADIHQKRALTYPVRDVSTITFDLTKAYEYDPSRKADNMVLIADAYQRRSETWPKSEERSRNFDLIKAREYREAAAKLK